MSERRKILIDYLIHRGAVALADGDESKASNSETWIIAVIDATNAQIAVWLYELRSRSTQPEKPTQLSLC